MVEFVIGLVIGAAFAPLWMRLYAGATDQIKAWLNPPEPPA